MPMKLEDYLTKKTTLIEKQLSLLLPESEAPYQLLFEAARYTLLGGGKRIRPILALSTAEMYGACNERVLTAACSLEMIHCYSMVHDDLPCMDDDDFRRGKPTLHKKYGEGYAVLAGDFLLTHAFEILSKDQNLSNDQKVRLIALLSESSGGHGMIGGQVMDLLSEEQMADLQTLEILHQKKTGALITASILFGAIIGEAKENEISLLATFGNQIGLAFQVMDDILDITAGDKKRGSASSSDLNNKKSTYVSLLGLDKAKETAEKLVQNAQKTLDQLPYNTEVLGKLAHYIINRSY